MGTNPTRIIYTFVVGSMMRVVGSNGVHLKKVRTTDVSLIGSHITIIGPSRVGSSILTLFPVVVPLGRILFVLIPTWPIVVDEGVPVVTVVMIIVVLPSMIIVVRVTVVVVAPQLQVVDTEMSPVVGVAVTAMTVAEVAVVVVVAAAVAVAVHRRLDTETITATMMMI